MTRLLYFDCLTAGENVEGWVGGAGKECHGREFRPAHTGLQLDADTGQMDNILGPVSLTVFFYHNSNSMKNLFHSHLDSNYSDHYKQLYMARRV